MDPRDPVTADAVEGFLDAVLDRSLDEVVAVKPQSAFFERLGWPGMRVLARSIGRIRAAGVPVVLDAKRGDIGSTATAYAAGLLGGDAPFPADALTVNPFLGRDSLAPFVKRAAATRTGLFVLVKTSNPGGADLQDLAVPGDARTDGTLSEAIAGWLAPLAEERRGPETGWSSVGAVVGATRSEETERLREILPHSLFLVPGFGAQGGGAADAVRAFVPGPGGRREGGLVNSSRGLLFPEVADGSAGAWERAIDAARSAAVGALGAAIA